MIEQRRKEEVANKEYLESRQKWMLAVTAIYWTAMGLAIMEETSGLAAATSAGTATCASVAHKLSKPCGKAYAACYAAHFPACLGTMPIGTASTKPNFANPASYPISQSTCAGAGPYIQGCLTHTNTYHGIAWANCQPFSPGGGIKGWLMAKAVTMAYSSALTRNSGSPAAKYVVMLAGLLELMVPSLQKLTMAAYNYPIPRSVTFAVSAGLATTVTAGLTQRIGVAKENIKKLDKFVAQYRLETDDDTVIQHDKPKEDDAPSTQDAMNGDAPKLSSTSLKSNALAKSATESKVVNKSSIGKTCLSQDGEKVEFSEKACSSPIQVTKPRFGESQNKVLEDAGRLSTDMAQALAEGDTQKADVIASNLSSMLGNIKAATQELQNKRLEMLKLENQEPEDFNKLVGEHIGTLSEELFKATKEKNINLYPEEKSQILETALLASNAPSSVTDGTVDSGAKKTITKIPERTAPDFFKQFEEGTEQAQNSHLVTADNPHGLSDEVLRAAKANGYAELHEKMKYHTSKEEGISSIPDSSIFKQVSNRYFLNYTRFFNQRKISPSEKSQSR